MLRSIDGGCILSVRVHPGAKQNAIIGTHANALKISITTPPSDGRANNALIAFLAERLNIPRTSIELISGPTNRSKAFRIIGITAAEAERFSSLTPPSRDQGNPHQHRCGTTREQPGHPRRQPDLCAQGAFRELMHLHGV